MGNFCVKQIAPFRTCHERYMYSVHLSFDSNEFSNHNITLKLAYHNNQLFLRFFLILKHVKSIYPALYACLSLFENGHLTVQV